MKSSRPSWQASQFLHDGRDQDPNRDLAKRLLRASSNELHHQQRPARACPSALTYDPAQHKWKICAPPSHPSIGASQYVFGSANSAPVSCR